jgi:hypothetical protein
MAVDVTTKPHQLIASDRVEGTAVRRPNGDMIGHIERLMIDRQSILRRAEFWRIPWHGDQPAAAALGPA